MEEAERCDSEEIKATKTTLPLSNTSVTATVLHTMTEIMFSLLFVLILCVVGFLFFFPQFLFINHVLKELITLGFEAPQAVGSTWIHHHPFQTQTFPALASRKA